MLTLAALGALLAPLTLATPLAQAATDTPATTRGEAARARVIVQFKASASLMHALSAGGTRGAQHAAALSQRTGLKLVDGHPIGDRAQVVFADGMSSSALAARLSQDSEIEFAEPDQRRRISAVPNDPLYPGAQPTATPTVGQWYLRAPNATTVSAINAEAAWNTTMGTSSVVVAVLDTGVRFDHPDLEGKLYPGYDFIADVKTANDGTGRDADPSDPGDWVTQAEVDTDPAFKDCADSVASSSWHGTQVAGLVGAATHNSVGMASVGRNVMVLPVRVLGKCGGFDSDITQAMLWAAGLSSSPVVNPHPAKVINLSLGSQGACTAMYQNVVDQLTNAGVTVVASAGNDEGLAVNAPANCTGVIGVAGVRHTGTKVGFSSIGPQVTISAPGGNCVNTMGACLFPLLTTDNLGATGPGTNSYSTSFRSSLGTSFSSPLVAGTIGLMLSVNPALTPAQIRSTLQSSARPFPAPAGVAVCHAPNTSPQDECACTTSTCGAGLLDTRAAVAAVAPAQAPFVPFSASTANPAVGTSVALDGSLATVAAGSGIYAWTITEGASLASFSSATNASTATLVANAAGPVTVTLTVTDTLGVASSASTRMTIGAVSAPSPTPTPTPAPDSGGGGALGLHWLLLLALATAAVARRRAA
ncbi:MAG TPA: S8 family peptidase [Albitalea sp.]